MRAMIYPLAILAALAGCAVTKSESSPKQRERLIEVMRVPGGPNTLQSCRIAGVNGPHGFSVFKNVLAVSVRTDQKTMETSGEAIHDCLKEKLLLRSEDFVEKANSCLAGFGISIALGDIREEQELESQCGQPSGR